MAHTVDPVREFPIFVSEVLGRLQAGRAAYGDTSFDLPPSALLDEIQAEILDVCGWSFILWSRIAALKAKTKGG